MTNLEAPLRVLIADDELLARRRLSRLLSAMTDVEIVAECETGEEVLEVLEHEPVDLAVLDIQMPGLTGLDVSGLIGKDGPQVVFATAHPEHALDAFEVGAVDYVVKPIEAARLAQAVERARQRFSAPDPVDRLALTVRGEVRLVEPRSITHALFDGHLVTVYVHGEELLTEMSLQELSRRLPRAQFLRVHRRALLNLEHIERLTPLPSGGYSARTDTGETVPVSRGTARKLRRRLGL